jgi:hypothetical protein
MSGDVQATSTRHAFCAAKLPLGAGHGPWTLPDILPGTRHAQHTTKNSGEVVPRAEPDRTLLGGQATSRAGAADLPNLTVAHGRAGTVRA